MANTSYCYRQHYEADQSVPQIPKSNGLPLDCDQQTTHPNNAIIGYLFPKEAKAPYDIKESCSAEGNEIKISARMTLEKREPIINSHDPLNRESIQIRGFDEHIVENVPRSDFISFIASPTPFLSPTNQDAHQTRDIVLSRTFIPPRPPNVEESAMQPEIMEASTTSIPTYCNPPRFIKVDKSQIKAHLTYECQTEPAEDFGIDDCYSQYYIGHSREAVRPSQRGFRDIFEVSQEKFYRTLLEKSENEGRVSLEPSFNPRRNISSSKSKIRVSYNDHDSKHRSTSRGARSVLNEIVNGQSYSRNNRIPLRKRTTLSNSSCQSVGDRTSCSKSRRDDHKTKKHSSPFSTARNPQTLATTRVSSIKASENFRPSNQKYSCKPLQNLQPNPLSSRKPYEIIPTEKNGKYSIIHADKLSRSPPQSRPARPQPQHTFGMNSIPTEPDNKFPGEENNLHTQRNPLVQIPSNVQPKFEGGQSLYEQILSSRYKPCPVYKTSNVKSKR